MVVDFDQHIIRIQQILLRASYAHIAVSDDLQLKFLIEEVQKVLDLCPEGYPRRNILFFLLLNSDAEFINIISEDENFAHLIDTGPRLDQTVILRTILKVDGLSFLHQLLICAPCIVTVSLLEIFLTSEALHPSKTGETLTRVYLSKACFHKLLCCPSDHVDLHTKFLDSFKILQTVKYECVPLTLKNCVGSLEHERKSLNFLLDLQVCSVCLQSDNWSKNCWEGFTIMCRACDKLEEKEHVPFCKELHECRDLIVSKCFQQASKISLDDWLEWAEIEAASSKTYQQAIGEIAHTLRSQLEAYEGKLTLFDACNLIEALSAFARKPISEEECDELSLGLEEIKARLLKNGQKTDGTFKLLLHHPDVLEDQEAVELVKEHLIFLNSDDVLHLLTIISARVDNSNDNCEGLEVLKQLSFDVTKHLPFDVMVKIQRQLLDKNGASVDLGTREFSLLLQEALNKASFSPVECDKEWCCELLRLSILRPTAVVRKALEVGFENFSIAKYMLAFLHFLRPVSEEEVCKWIFEKLQAFTDHGDQKDTFPPFVIELTKGDFLSGEQYLRIHALPALHQAIGTQNWAVASMLLTSVQLVLQYIVENSCKFTSAAALILFLVQTIDVLQQQSEMFLMECVLARGKTVKALKWLQALEISEAEKSWLCSLVPNYSLVTQCYLVSFVFQEKQFADFSPCFDTDLKTTEQVACFLAGVVPFLTITEWKGFAASLKQRFAQHDDCGLIVFKSFHQAVFIKAAACGENIVKSPHLFSCIQYMLGSLGDILKSEVLPVLKDQNTLTVLEETLYLLSKLPVEVWNTAGMGLLPELMKMIDKVPCDENTTSILRAILHTCPVSEGRYLLESKLSSLSKDLSKNVAVKVT